MKHCRKIRYLLRSEHLSTASLRKSSFSTCCGTERCRYNILTIRKYKNHLTAMSARTSAFLPEVDFLHRKLWNVVLITGQLQLLLLHRSASSRQWFLQTAVPFAACIPVSSSVFYAVGCPAVLSLKPHPLPIQSHLFCAAAVPFLLPLAELAVPKIPENR